MGIVRHTRIRLALLASTIALSLAFAAPIAAVNIGEEGCTPGFWKNHTDVWEEYSPDQTLDTLFIFPASLSSFGDDTLLEALNYEGGSGLLGGTRILLRAAVAAYLNAAHEGVGYPYRRFTEPGNLELWINTALASEDRGEMIELAGILDEANNLGCTL